jgi:diguanylate cyclase (GGDEF)-like protein
MTTILTRSSELRRKVITANDQNTPAPLFEALIEQATEYIHSHDYAQALSNLFEAIELGNDHGMNTAICFLELARIATITGDPTQSKAYAQKAIDQIPLDLQDETLQGLAVKAYEVQQKIALIQGETGTAKYLQRQIYNRLLPLGRPRETLLAGTAIVRGQIKEIRSLQHIQKTLAEYETQARQFSDVKPLVEIHIAQALLCLKFQLNPERYIKSIFTNGTVKQKNDFVVGASIYMDSQQKATIFERYEPLEDQQHEYLQVLTMQAEAYETLGNFAKALDCYKTIVKVDQQIAEQSLEQAIGKVQDQYQLYAAQKQMSAQKRTIIDLGEAVKDLEVMATRDALTNAHNRRYFNNHLEQSKSLVQYCVVLLDIDHFKQVNDNYGHDMGDVVLKQVAQLLMTETRTPDVVARYGGEEFAILLQADSDQGYRACERIRKSIEGFGWQHVHKNLSVTASLGLCHHSFGHENLLKFADLALYQAKKTGRNKTVIYALNNAN